MKYKEIPFVNEIERFLSRITVNKDTGCWDWAARVDIGGYGQFCIKNSFYRSHRVSYTIFNKPVPTNLVIDHVCRNRKCCNPDHMRITTHKENTLTNSVSISAINKTKTHCNSGHEFNTQNTYNYKGKRQCRVCIRNRAANKRMQKLGEK